MTDSAWAAVFHGQPGALELRRFSVPCPRGAEVLVRVLGCTLCASDLHSYFGRRSTPTPTILGHEIVGEILNLGEDPPTCDLRGQPLRVGDRVVWTLLASCGRCDYCLHDLPQACRHGVKYGHQRLQEGRELLGGLAEYCLLLSGTGLVRVPTEFTLAEACPLGCATATVAAGCEAAGELVGRRVLVVGAGMLGLTACAYAATLGAQDVWCSDPRQDRRQRALRFGASKAIAPEDLASADLTDGLGIDVAFEISGSNAGFETALRTVRRGGRIILLGAVFPSPPVSLDLERLVRRNLSLRGVQNYGPRHLKAAVEFVAQARSQFPFADLVAEWLPLSAAAEAFERAAGGKHVRVGVCPD